MSRTRCMRVLNVTNSMYKASRYCVKFGSVVLLFRAVVPGCMSHVTHVWRWRRRVEESCRPYVEEEESWVMYCMWVGVTSHVTHMCGGGHVAHILDESCHPYVKVEEMRGRVALPICVGGVVSPSFCISHVTYTWRWRTRVEDVNGWDDLSHIWMSHVTHMNESCHTYEWVMSHIWMSHVTHMNEVCHTYEWVLSQIWMSLVTHMIESCHTYEWVMSRMNMNESCHT